MDTFFQYEVLTDNNKSLVIGGAKTLDYAKIESQKDCNYYLTECDYDTLIVSYSELCPVCYNKGTTKQYKKNSKLIYKVVKCPNCKGHNPTFTDSFIVTKEGIKPLN